MNKRILSIMMCLLVVVAMIVMAVPASAAHHDSTTIYVTTETTTAAPSDVIDFNVVLGPVSDLGTVQMTLVIPEGLTYVAGSGKVADGVKSAMGFDTFDWTEETLMINGVASEANYESDNDTVLGSFQCTVNEGFSGTASVGLDNLEFYDCQTWDMITDRFSVASTSVTVGGETSGDDPTEIPTIPDETVIPTVPDETVVPTASGETSATVAPTQGGKSTGDQTPTTAPKKNSNSPKTSDSGMIFLWIGLAAVALIGAGVAFFAKAKKNR